ncbi:MAG: alpha/beta hydrolase [Bilifractor sp.]|jgi:hypothetical protein
MKLAVIFPGIGYHCDKPLLYYSSRIAKNLGMEIVKVPFRDLAGKKGLIGNEEKMHRVFEEAREQAEEILKKIEWDRAEEPVFLSKSIGTAVAASYARDHGLCARHIYYTPVAGTFAFMEKGSGIAFHGTDDPWVETEAVRRGCREKMVPLYITEGANHSLETGDVMTDLQNMRNIMEKTREYLTGREKIFRILRISEADYGCEELPANAGVPVSVILEDAAGMEMSITAEDEDLYRRNLDAGDLVVIRDRKLFRA